MLSGRGAGVVVDSYTSPAVIGVTAASPLHPAPALSSWRHACSGGGVRTWTSPKSRNSTRIVRRRARQQPHAHGSACCQQRHVPHLTVCGGYARGARTMQHRHRPRPAQPRPQPAPAAPPSLRPPATLLEGACELAPGHACFESWARAHAKRRFAAADPASAAAMRQPMPQGTRVATCASTMVSDAERQLP